LPALIALPRLKPEFYGLPQNEGFYYTRVVKEAVHELGHTFGLNHCKKRECVMHFSNSLADTDYKGKDFCEDCLNRLESVGAVEPIKCATLKDIFLKELHD